MTEADLDAWLREFDPSALDAALNQLYLARARALDAIVSRQLLDAEARRLRVSRQELVDSQQLTAVTPELVDAELKRLQVAGATGSNPGPDRSVLTKHLQERARQDAVRALIEQLREREARAGRLVLLLEPPRRTLKASSVPPRGEGRVVISEFGDFTCEYCRQLQEPLRELLEEFKGQVVLRWYDFPLSGPAAQSAAVAARCAGEQGRFWDYADQLFGSALDGTASSVLPLYFQIATRLGLERKAFESCVRDSRPSAEIERDLKEAEHLGLRATPTLFIEGRTIQGLASKQYYRTIIQEEIRRARGDRRP